MAEDSWVQRRSCATAHAGEARSDFEVDYARIVHAGAFRRLQGKTQILSLGDDDFYRTRLTHSLEVAQVAEGIMQHLRHQADRGHDDILPSTVLVRALGLAHDIGHPPYGHGGETALNYCLRDAGGFEGNAQTLRLLARLEPYVADHGADLTRRCLLGLLKYPVLRSAVVDPTRVPRLHPGPTSFSHLDPDSCKPPKACYDSDTDLVDWILDPVTPSDRDLFGEVRREQGRHARSRHKSLDCTIMDAADDIAYGVHDLEDAIELGLISEADFRTDVPAELCEEVVRGMESRPVYGVAPSYDGIVNGLFGAPDTRKRVIGRLVHVLIRATGVRELGAFEEPLLDHRLEMAEAAQSLLTSLQLLVERLVIRSPAVQHLEFKGQRMVVAVFEALAAAPRDLLPGPVRATFEACSGDLRIIGDYVSSLTDAGLVRLYGRLFSPGAGTVFDRF